MVVMVVVDAHSSHLKSNLITVNQNRQTILPFVHHFFNRSITWSCACVCVCVLGWDGSCFAFHPERCLDTRVSKYNFVRLINWQNFPSFFRENNIFLKLFFCQKACVDNQSRRDRSRKTIGNSGKSFQVSSSLFYKTWPQWWRRREWRHPDFYFRTKVFASFVFADFGNLEWFERFAKGKMEIFHTSAFDKVERLSIAHFQED